ncbi:hypothetical protein [Paenibacillus pinihumi]|uniref:hypothetical protein n=1 Tax=Paenibacillus pinihumi TaxID=669462 RepID=UPI0004253508|nr:hypothetical protein [Paenibacillus pinihumi]
MSYYTFLAADYELPEANYTGVTTLKVKDILQMNPVPVPHPLKPWEEWDQESTVLYAEGEADMGGLYISACTNPPYNLEYYITKPFVYRLEGNIQEKWQDNLLEYLDRHIPGNAEVELWMILFGEGLHKPKVRRLSFGELTREVFGEFNRERYACYCLERRLI